MKKNVKVILVVGCIIFVGTCLILYHYFFRYSEQIPLSEEEVATEWLYHIYPPYFNDLLPRFVQNYDNGQVTSQRKDVCQSKLIHKIK